MSIWGIANPPPASIITGAGADQACAAASFQVLNSISYAAEGVSNNIEARLFFYGLVLLGATPPTSIQMGVDLDGGSTLDSFNLPPSLLVANANIIVAVPLTFIMSRAVAQANHTIQLYCNPVAQAVTIKANTKVVVNFSLAADL